MQTECCVEQRKICTFSLRMLAIGSRPCMQSCTNDEDDELDEVDAKFTVSFREVGSLSCLLVLSVFRRLLSNSCC